MVTELAVRFAGLGMAPDALTVVYDAGCDSADNQAHLEAAGLHYVGSLRPSDHPDLLAVPARRFRAVDAQRFGGLTAFESRAVALGASRRDIVTHSPTFHQGQAQGFAQTLAKARRQLAELQAHQTHVSTLSGRGIGPYPASYPEATDGGVGPAAPGFLLPFGHRHSLVGSSCTR